MNKNPVAEAQRLLKSARIVNPPVRVDKVAEKLKARLTFEPFEGEGDISGILYRDEKQTIIGINSTHSNVRQRFTIAHEIGHLVLHEGELFVDQAVRVNFRDKRSSLAENRQEIEANKFAAELLMPAEMIQREIEKRVAKKIATEAQLVAELARVFDVSEQAMGFRLFNLGIISSPADDQRK
jgi:Zn-dependent peptidase ImmA (M78 family)